jgi:DNA recombination protein RmuC
MKVFIVSPISIMPLLNLISETWRQMELTKNADDVINTAKELSKRLKKYEDLYDTVGNRIASLGKAYNDSVSSYNSRLKPSVRDIQQLQGIDVDKTKLENVNLDVKPVIERIAADSEEE